MQALKNESIHRDRGVQSGNSDGLRGTQRRFELISSCMASAAKQFLTGALEEYCDISENTLILNFHEDLQSSEITMPVFQYSTITLGIVSLGALKGSTGVVC